MKHSIDAVKSNPPIGDVSLAHAVATNGKEAKEIAQAMLAAHPEAEVAVISWGDKNGRKVKEVKRGK